MKDIPFFTTETGVASLILKEIPYRGQAFVIIRDVQPGGLEELVTECRTFCRMAGAERIFASGHEGLEGFPLYTAVWELRRDGDADWEQARHLFPVTEETAPRWRSLYNEKMRRVDNSATLEARDEKKLYENPGAYFVHDNGALLGIGWLEGTKLLALAAAKPGAGETILHTLLTLTAGEMTLEVASTNQRALRLYERLGFLKTREISRWHEI